MKKHNFCAGPSILPREVIEQTAQAILDFNGSGLSILEISHRSKDFQAVIDEAVALFKEILNIPEGYSVLFLGGGASMQFCMSPHPQARAREPPALGTCRITRGPFQRQDSLSCYFQNASRQHVRPPDETNSLGS